MPDALQLLRQDHQEVKDLFKRFESSEHKREKQEIADRTVLELVVHSMIEEEVFYPAVREELAGQGEEEEIMFEAEEEHHVVDLLIEELMKMDSSDESFDAKYKVMAENVKHHIQEEESMMLPKAAELGSDRLNELGEAMFERKTDLMREFTAGGRQSSRGRRSTNGRASNGRRTTRTTTRRGTRSTGSTRRTSTRGATTRRTTTARASGSRAGGTRSRSTSSRTPSRGRTSARARTGARTATRRTTSRTRGR